MNTIKSTPNANVVTATHVLVRKDGETYPIHQHWFDPVAVIAERAERERRRRLAALTRAHARWNSERAA